MVKILVFAVQLLSLLLISRADTPCTYYVCKDSLMSDEPNVCILRMNSSYAYVKPSCRSHLSQSPT